MYGLQVDKQILRTRFDALGLTAYALAKRVSEIRASLDKKPGKNPRNLISAVSKILENPDAASFKNVEAVIKAMGGEIVIRWEKTEVVVTGHEEIKL